MSEAFLGAKYKKFVGWNKIVQNFAIRKIKLCTLEYLLGQLMQNGLLHDFLASIMHEYA